MTDRLKRPLAVVIACAIFLVPALPVSRALAQDAAPGPECTITGTPGADRLVGTPGDDVICGLAGNDLLLGNGGDDFLDGGPGRDVLLGGSGDDVLAGGDGSDTLKGNAGRDLLLGGAGRDSLAGGGEGDQFVGGEHRDRISADAAGDTCADDGQDRVAGDCAADATPPAISEVTASSSVSAGTTLTVSWRASDSSGLYFTEQSPATWLRIGGASGWVTWCGFTVPATRIAGDAFDGRYEASCAVPGNAVDGEYSLFFGASDPFGNAAFTDGSDVFIVAGGSPDDAAPEVTELSLSAPSFTPGASLTFRWRATDATGVAYVIPWAFGPNGFLVDVDGSGGLWMSYGIPTLVEGDAVDGLYEVTVQLSPEALDGTYTIWLSRGDILGNRDFTSGAADGSPYGSFEVNP